MASSSSSRTWRYRVFASFHGPDVRKTFMSHLRKQFDSNGISMFDDQGIERSQTIASALTRAIRVSRISIVVLSKNYASSSWCLNELIEILNCKEDIGQIIMTMFYGVDPSDVRKQIGEFGSAFSETCEGKTEEERQRWSQALTDVSNIAGEHFLNWDDESKMIEKISRDVSKKLNTKISSDFDHMVGIEGHLKQMQSLLHLDDEDRAMIVGICGPAGIGKTTIARALHSRLSSRFQLNCFMENLRGSLNSSLDDHGLKLCLQEKLLSKILDHNGMRIHHLDTVPERLFDQKVMIILDDVDDLQQLQALANETNWFGPGSRIIVTTEDQEILEQHDINKKYHVDFSTKEIACKIFCRYAFKQSFAPRGFEKLVERITTLCSNLPLGLRVMGSSLRGKNKNDYEAILQRLEKSLDPKIEGVLKVGYDSLHENDQSLFLHIAFFFNNREDDHVMAMFADNNLDVRLGLKTLTYKSLIQKSAEGKISMHKLLQQVGRQAVQRQEPWKRQILIDAREICDVLENDKGSRSVIGVSLDISTIPNGVNISAGGFKRLSNLQFLSVYKIRFGANGSVHVPDDMDFPPRLRFLLWELYPRRCLPSTFRPEYLVELKLQYSLLHKLWEGTQPLTNLKNMDLLCSMNLKELPDLSYAISLKTLILNGCSSLVEIPSSIGNLQKLELLDMGFCIELQVVPTHFSLASLQKVNIMGCSKLRRIPEISKNITTLTIVDTMLEALPEYVRLWSHLQFLSIYGSVNVLPNIPQKLQNRSGVGIDKIPEFIKDLHGLVTLHISGCSKLASLPKLPSSLRKLEVDNCESLKTLISFPLDSQIGYFNFPNCLKLCHEARRVITQYSLWACIPGKNLPEVFNHRAIGNSLTIRSDFYRFRMCVVVSPKEQIGEAYHRYDLLCHIYINGFAIYQKISQRFYPIRMEHLLISQARWLEKEINQNDEVVFKFHTTSSNINIIECGIEIVSDKADISYESRQEQESDWRTEFDESRVKRLKT